MKKAMASAALLLALLLAGCQGKALPLGMDADELLQAGRDVMLRIVAGEYEEVHSALREDVRETVTVEDIQALALEQLDGAGVYKEINSSMTTGQTVQNEQVGIAVMYCTFSEKEVLFRVSFDSEMRLVGLSIHPQ